MPHHISEGAARIRDAAIDLFGRQGVAGTTLKQIAAAAEVSQALVVHHFGSKDGLRQACDRHVAAVTRSAKETSLGQRASWDPFDTIRQIEQSQPLMRYLARALTDGGPQANDLVDEFVADAQEYLADAVEAGQLKPSQTPYERTVVLVMFSMGALAMHEQLNRLLGVDLLGDHASPQAWAPYFRPVLELFTQGLIEDGALSEITALFDAPRSDRPQLPAISKGYPASDTDRVVSERSSK